MPLHTSVLQDKRYIWYRGDSVRYVVVEVEAAPMSAEPSVESTDPIAIVFDASDSANKQAIGSGESIISELLDRLPRQRHLSIVVYSRRDESISRTIEGRWGTSAPRLKIKPGLGLVDAWLLGAEVVARAMTRSKFPNGRVLLLQTSNEDDARAYLPKLGQVARGLEERGIATTAIGVGSEIDLSCLIAVDEMHGQQQLFAETPTEIAQILATNVFKVYPIVATDVSVSLTASPHVEVSLIDCLHRVEKGRMSISLGETRAGAKNRAIFKLRFPSGDIGKCEAVEAKVTWRPKEESRKHQTSQGVTFEFAPGRINSPQPVDRRATLLVTQAWRNAILWGAYQLISQGHHDAADRFIKAETFHLERYCRSQYQARNQLVLLARGLRTLGSA